MSGGSLVSPETRQRLRRSAVPVATALGRLGLSPNALTILGFAGTCLAAVLAANREWLAAGVLVLAFGIFDMFDGALARATGRVTAFGGFLDSTLDRTGENLVLAGIAFGCAAAGFPMGAGLAGLAMAFGSIVTYTRAKAEALGLHGEVGVAPRPERLLIVTVGLTWAGIAGGIGPLPGTCAAGASGPCFASDQFQAADLALGLALGLIAVLSAVTVIQRIRHVRAQSAGLGPTSTTSSKEQRA